MNSEYLHTNPTLGSKFHLRYDNEDFLSELAELQRVHVKCAHCPNWAGYATTARDMREVFESHRRLRHG